jgi:ATP-dependent DNA helicase RecG
LRAQQLFKDFEIKTFEDLLNHFPYRYFDKSSILKIKDINETSDYVLLVGDIGALSEEGEGRKKRLVAHLKDNTGVVQLVWFQQLQWVKKQVKDYGQYAVFGKVSSFNGQYSITHPEMDTIQNLSQSLGLQPMYGSTAKLTSMGLSNRGFGKIMYPLLAKLTPEQIIDPMPAYIRTQFQLMDLFEAYRQIHFPQSEVQAQAARHRFKWDELFLMQLQTAQLKLKQTAQVGYIFSKVGELFNGFYANHMPFELTNAQKRVIKEIRSDLCTGHQMNRLVQGDVGSGKTMVAALSMLIALDNGFQACMMAPTEILARQHCEGISELLSPMGIRVEILTGTVKGKVKKQLLLDLKEGKIQILIGTHALIEDSVQFHNLGIAVVDEQHKFGVGQRSRLWKKNQLPPHILVMTATPIPRTMAMTLYGDLDISTIDELPAGRKAIQTFHRTDIYRAKVMDFLKHEIAKGRQVYIVYPLIEESEKLDYESLMAGYEQVKSWFPEHKYNIAMVHGRQNADERKRNMERFISGDAHILVATTVIEVGVNVPNASVMLIESAERFGLSQLHQLRGRVGRGAEQSYCILLTSNGISKDSFERMKVMVSTSDGFVIAEKDLELRGPGDIYGTRQSGALKLRVADLVTDSQLLATCREAVIQLIHLDPNLSMPQHNALREAMVVKKSGHHWNKIS